MKKYELKFTKGEAGVFRMSTVLSPATNTLLVMFDDELKAMEFQDDDKQIIYSVAMRPNMLIPRKDINGGPAMVFYSEETVSDLQQNFFKNNSHNGATVNHDGKVRPDMYFFESWIVRNEMQAQSVPGLDAKIGDWILGQKVDNPEVWAKVKNKELMGFSIEAYLEPIEIKNTHMTKEEVDARIKAIMMAGDFKVGDTVKVTADPEKTFTIEAVNDDGTFSLKDADGVLKDYNADEIEAAVAVAAAADAEPAPDLQKQIDDLTAENNDLKANIAELEGKEVAMSKEIIATKKVAVEMAEEMAKGIKPVPVAKMYSEMTPLELYRASK